MHIAVINSVTNKVENIGTGDVLPVVAGYNFIFSDVAGIGDTYDGANFIKPVAPAAPAPTKQQQIVALEAQQTPRRMREAVNGMDNGWLKALDAQIAALRALP